jgi:PTH1 family peptidyl-tRNA hydrolase
MKLIVGLGNPGKEYVKTRHNVGFVILDKHLGEQRWSENQYADYISINTNLEKVIFIKPMTFMNLSGNAVNYFMKYYKIPIENILIIHDDMDIDIGSFKLKTNSGAGGHNGIQSIIDSLASDSFLRLKIGISRPTKGESSDYVLHAFSKKEQAILDEQQVIFNDILEDFISNTSAESLMNKYNGNL